MPIRLNDVWHPDGTTDAQEQRVYRDVVLIARVRRWQATKGDNAATREWFTSERLANKAFVPIKGEQPDFEEALRWLVFCIVAN